MLKKTYIADSSSLIAYLHAEDGADVIRDIIRDSDSEIIIHALNLCEIYYDVLRENGPKDAEQSVNSLIGDGIVVSEDLDRSFWMDVGNLKVNQGHLSLADCVAIALARRLNCELLTTDHHEMDKLVGSPTVSIKFIR